MRPTNGDRDHAYYRDLLAAHALGAVRPPEERVVAAHAAACQACRAELAHLRAVVRTLPLALEEREPAPTLRDRIQAAVWRDITAAGRSGCASAGSRP